VEALEDSVVLDVFSPVRQDWLRGAGVVAAIAPARRAGRLNVLAALHYE
jgi:hypothetical protein